MRAYSKMSLEDFAAQLRDIVVAQPFTPRQPLLVDMIDEIVSPMDAVELADIKAFEREEGETKGREDMRELMLARFDVFGMADEIGLTETQHEQILELLGRVKP